MSAGNKEIRKAAAEFCRMVRKEYVRVKNREWISALLAICGLYVLLAVLEIGCPIRFVTGISCAGCGMTRAWRALLQLDIQGAFSYHPLFWLPPVAGLLFLKKNKISIKLYRVFLFTIIAAFVIVYLYRMIGSDPVVVFEPEDGVVVRIINHYIRRR